MRYTYTVLAFAANTLCCSSCLNCFEIKEIIKRWEDFIYPSPTTRSAKKTEDYFLFLGKWMVGRIGSELQLLMNIRTL